jgi:opacity protein-like surface antigen
MFGVAHAASAGTSGGMYDMRSMLFERHPFANGTYPSAPAIEPAAGPAQPATGQVVQPAPPPSAAPQVVRPIVQQPATSDSTVAPPPPVMRYTPPPVAPVTEEEDRQRRMTPAPTRVAAMAEADATRESGKGFYLSFGGGFTTPDNLSGRTTSGVSFTTDLEDGYVVTSAIGLHIGKDVRGDLELASHAIDYDRTTIAGSQATGGSLVFTTLMLNAYYDLHFGWPLVPYFGGGAGLALLDGTTKVVGGNTLPGRDDTELAFQGVIGAAYEVTRRWSLGFDARYIGTSDEDVSAMTIGMHARYDM